jgi:hypothetical protein
MGKDQNAPASTWPAPRPLAFALVVLAILAVQSVTLLAMGHSPICTCGYVDLWHAPTSGPGTSQHLTDWYSHTHVIHGFGLYLLLWLSVPGMPFLLRLAIALGLEAVWEVVENTPLVIDRYRQSALAAGYLGDSVVNSLTDTVAAAFGFVLAWQMPVWSAVALIVGLEVFLAVTIRDNLTLNIIQLVYPSAAISLWQAGV